MNLTKVWGRAPIFAKCTKWGQTPFFGAVMGLMLCAVLLAVPFDAKTGTANWTGSGADAKWTTAANWGGTAPVAGDDLVFPGSVANTSTVNDFPAGTSFASILIASNAYSFSGNALQLSNGVTTTYQSGTVVLPLAIALPASAAFVVATGGTLRMSGALSDANAAGGIVKSGGGTLELTAPNTCTGATTVRDGTLRLNRSGGLALSGALTIGDGSGTPGSAVVSFGAASQLSEGSVVKILGDGSLQLDGHDQQLLATLEMTGGEVATGAGLLTFAAEKPDLALKATSAIVNATPRAAVVSGNVRLGSTPSGMMVHAIDVARGPGVIDLDLSATISGNHLYRQNTGILQLGGSAADNTFRSLFALDGLTLLAKIGHVAVKELTVGLDSETGTVGNARFLASQQIDPASLLHVGDRGIVDLNGFDQTLDAVVFRGGSLTTGSGTLTIRNAIQTSVMFQTATAMLNGNVNLNGGVVRILVGKALPPGVPELVVDGTMSNGGITLDIYPVATQFGTLELRGTHAYTGDTRVEAGNLIVNGSIASSVTLLPDTTPDPDRLIDAILRGSGRVGGTVTGTGGTIAPGGGGAGILRVGGIALDQASTFAIRLSGPAVGTQYDQVDVTGAVNLGGAKLQLDLGYVPEPGASFTIIRNDGSDAVVGTFAGLPEGALLVVDNVGFRISYRGGDGNDVVLSTRGDTPAAIPTLGLPALALAALMLLAVAGSRLRGRRA